MSWSKQAHRATAMQQGRAAAQRVLGNLASSAEGGDLVDVHLRGMAEWVQRVGYTVDGGKCIFCARTTGLKTGSLPQVGVLLFCPYCAGSYHTLKQRQVLLVEEETEPELKVHLRDGAGLNACGVLGGRRTTDLMREVTCRRCLAYYGTHSIGKTVLDWLRGGR